MGKQESYAKKFIKDLLGYTPSSLIPALIGFLTVPLLTKLFEPSDYGNFILTIAYVGFFSMIIQTLLGSPITRFFFAHKMEGSLKPFYDTIFALSFFSILLVTVIILVVLQLIEIDTSLYYLMIVGVPLFVLTSIFGVLRQILIAKEKAKLYSFFIVFQSVFGFLFGIIIILYLKTGISGLIWGNILSFLIALPFMYYFAFKGFYIGKKFSKTINLKIIKFGAPLVISNLAAWILSLSDRYILEFYRGSLEVGIYSASYAISEQTITVLWTLFMTASYPLIVRTWETHGEEFTQNYISRLTRYYLLISFPAALGLSVLSKPVIIVLTSTAYYEGYQIIPLVVFGALLLGLQWWAQLGLLLQNKPNMIGVTVLVAGILNIIFNIFLVPIYGYMGAAISTFISYLILLLIMMKISHNYLRWNFPFKSFSKILCASAFMGMIVYYLETILNAVNFVNLSIEVLIGVSVYLCLLILLKGVEKDELEQLKQLFKK